MRSRRREYLGIAARGYVAEPEALEPIVAHRAEHVPAVRRNGSPCCFARIRDLRDGEFLERRQGRTMQEGVDPETCRAEQDQHCEHSRRDPPFVLLRGSDDGRTAGLRGLGR